MLMLFSLLLFSLFSNKLVLKVFSFSCCGECVFCFVFSSNEQDNRAVSRNDLNCFRFLVAHAYASLNVQGHILKCFFIICDQ